MSSCPALEDLTGLALCHLDEAEGARLRTHVLQCPHCQEVLADWNDLISLLPLAEAQVAPPPELKRRLLASLGHEVAPKGSSRLWLPLATRWVAAVATFALLLGGYALWRVERISPHTVALRGVGPGAGAIAQVALFTEGQGTHISINATGLPRLDNDEVYQLWMIKDGERQAVCAFKVDDNGHGETTYWLPGPVAYDALGVTREPDATYSHEPRGPKVLGS